MKKLQKFGLLLAWGFIALGVFAACANTKQALKDVNQGVQVAAEVVNTAAEVVNAADKVVAKVENISADAQRLKTRASLLSHYGRHQVVRGDTLWALSRRQHGTGFLWPLICEQNGLKNCHRIKVGEVLRYALPDLLETYSADELEKYRQTAYQSK